MTAEGRVGTRPEHWHAVPAGEVLDALATRADGLTAVEAADWTVPPADRDRDEETFLGELVESLREPLQLLLVVVAVLSAVFGELRDAVAIAVVVVAVALTETLTERRAGRAIAALHRLTAPTARVRRDGDVGEVPVAGVVAGDVVVLEAGDLVPADARVLRADALRVDESTLTGEPVPVPKTATPVSADAALADRASMVYAGTPVVAGAASVVVVATGDDTELGRLGRLVADEREPRTPLQLTLARLAKAVLVVAVVASVGVPLVGLLTGQDPVQMLLSGLTLAFATIPEELPILVTVLLAVGGRRLARRGALLRRLRAGETLGGVTVVVTDKTGTLTENRLELARVAGDRRRVLDVAHRAGAGRDPLAAAVAAARTGGVDDEPVAVFPFDPERTMVSRAYRTAAGTVELAVVGAPEPVLARCVAADGAYADLAAMTAAGLRVVAVASRCLDTVPTDRDDAERDLSYVGLVAFDDPLRDGVPAAVAELRRAGVATVVVSGDHPSTVAAVAGRAGLPPTVPLLGGAELAALDDADLSARLGHGAVVARATPADKLRIVRLLQARGERVAVTGDGVNDGPALAAADVGVAMGRRGSDLARQAADLVLTDDAYPTVAAAVATGRNVGAQLRRAVVFYLGAKLALVAVMLAGFAAGMPAVFTPATIVLLELFMDLGASVAFVAEPAAPGAMRVPPRRGAFLDRGALTGLVLVAVTLTVAVLPTYLLVADTEAARAGALAAWLAAHALVAWCLRARPALSWRTNPAFPLWAAAAVTVAALVSLTPAGEVADLTPLSTPAALVTAVAVASAVVLAVAGRFGLRLGTGR